MTTTSTRFAARLACLAVIGVMLISNPAVAESGFTSTWQSIYPSSQSDNNVISGTGLSCQLCHDNVSGGNNFNAYGWRIKQLKDSGQSTSNAIMSAGSADSDGDPGGATNAEEIAADSQPGWTVGPNNTTYSGNGNTQSNQLPPSAIDGDLDPPMGSWTNLGNGLAGTAGTPVLNGDGPLTGGSTATLSLTGGLPNGTAVLVLGVSVLAAPFKGGVLVPAPDILIPGLPLDPSGALAFGLPWPAFPSGVSLYWQYWIPDPGGVFGFAASNGLQSTSG